VPDHAQCKVPASVRTDIVASPYGDLCEFSVVRLHFSFAGKNNIHLAEHRPSAAEGLRRNGGYYRLLLRLLSARVAEIQSAW